MTGEPENPDYAPSPSADNERNSPGEHTTTACAGTDTLFPRVYDELRGLAHARMSHEPAGHSLQTTALVHEVYVRLQKDPSVQWNSPAHFFGAAAESMRRILIERARRKLAKKHGGGRARIPLDPDADLSADDDQAAAGMLDLDAALNALEAEDETVAQVVKLRYFAGLSVDETAAALSRSPRSVKRDWAFARAWLSRRLRSDVSE